MKKKILLIGASTGGPSLIKDLICCLDTISCSVIIIQHMKEDILPFFIKNIQETVSVPVMSTPLSIDFRTPTIIVCSKTSIIKKNGSSFEIVSDSTNEHYTPDINKFFSSFANYAQDFDVDVVIMTGIGSDGVDGAKLLKEKGATIYAQDEDSSPVYGMPKAAYESGIVDRVLSFEEIKCYFKAL